MPPPPGSAQRATCAVCAISANQALAWRTDRDCRFDASAGADGERRRGATRTLIIVFAYSCCCCARASLAENRALAVLVE